MSNTPLTNGGAAVLVAAIVAAAITVYLLAWWLLSNGRVAWRRVRPGLARSYVAAENRPLPTRLAGRFPRTYAAISGRFDPRHFAGLPLTLLVVAATYIGFLFLGLAEHVIASEEVGALDDFVDSLVAPLRNPILVKVFAGVTQLGATATLSAVAIVSTGFLWARGPAWGIPAVWIAIVGSQVTTWTGKFLIARPRPDFIFGVSDWSPSFPSGHATGAMAVYGIVAYVIARDLRPWRRQFDVIYWTGVLIVAIAFSRIYLSVHYPTDVAAGLLVGGFWVLAGIATAELVRRWP